MTKRLEALPSYQRVARSATRGFALTLALILIALTAIVVIAFLTTTSTERTTAAAYARIGKARQMAEAGADAAIARLITEMKYRPYHAIGYRSVNVGNFGSPPSPLTQIVPVITGPRTINPATPTYNTAPNPAEDVYLISVVGGAIPGSTAPTGLSTSNSVDLNANYVASEPKGWIGSPTSAATPIPFRAPWIDVLSDPTKAAQPDSSQPNYNPVIGRYAYWIEDETSKLDISTVGNQDNAGGFERGDGVDLPDRTPQPKMAVNDLDIGALPLLVSPTPAALPPGDIATITTNQAILNLRAGLAMLDARFLNRVGGQIASDVHETIKFYATAFSLSNDLAGTGRRRANVNALVTSPANLTTAVPPATIAGNIDDIAYVISGTHVVAGGLGPTPPPGVRVYESAPVFSNTLTDFGSRFFTSAAPTAAHKNMYLERIAANIRDYIDTDSQPTIIDATGPTVRAIGVPVHPIQTSGGGTAGTSEIVAFGKERVPLIQEYALRIRQVEFSPRTGTFANYKITIDHYVEFWNMSNRDILLTDLGPTPFLLIANQPGWDAGTLDSIPDGASRDTKLLLNLATNSNDNTALTSFPSGSVTVITTDPLPLSTPSPTGGIILTPDLTRVYHIPITPDNGTTGLRTYAGRTDRKSGSELRLNMIDRTTSSSDYETEIVLGNDFGILESAWGAGAIGSAISVNIDNATPPEDRLDDTKYHFRGASLKGNIVTSPSPTPFATTGDPRTNAEQMRFDLNGGSANNDKTRYFSSGLNNKTAGNSSLGAPNSTFVNPAAWIDYSSSTQSANDAPAVIDNAALTSIGQLGNIVDPVRSPGDATGVDSDGIPFNIKLSRSGGLTFKIGQPDGLAGGTRFTANWFNSAWRLADLFAARPVSNATLPPQPSEKVAPPTSIGKINVNGVLRDNGVAFRAALRSFNFAAAPNSDPQLNGRALAPADVDNLMTSITTYLTNNGPMMERGELSQLPFFNSGTAAGGSMAAANDRGREELFRRTVEMTTTRSASFTAYVIGEAVRQDRNGNRTTVGQKRLAITFQLEPQTAGAPFQNSTAPHAVVDSYRVRKIYAPN